MASICTDFGEIGQLFSLTSGHWMKTIPHTFSTRHSKPGSVWRAAILVPFDLHYYVRSGHFEQCKCLFELAAVWKAWNVWSWIAAPKWSELNESNVWSGSWLAIFKSSENIFLSKDLPQSKIVLDVNHNSHWVIVRESVRERECVKKCVHVKDNTCRSLCLPISVCIRDNIFV